MFFLKKCSCNIRDSNRNEIVVKDDCDIIENDCYVEIQNAKSRIRIMNNKSIPKKSKTRSFLLINKEFICQPELDSLSEMGKLYPGLLYISKESLGNSSIEQIPKQVKTISEYLKENIY